MGDTGDHRLPQGMTILYGENDENGDNPPDIGVQNFCTKTKFN